MKTTLIQEIWTRMDAYLTEEQIQTDQAGTSFHIPSWSGMINRLSPSFCFCSPAKKLPIQSRQHSAQRNNPQPDMSEKLPTRSPRAASTFPCGRLL